MAKNDNLTDFLTDVASAIRAKKGTTDKINPQDFSSEIESIETGGGGSTTDKFAQILSGTITEITAEDLSGITEIAPGAFGYYTHRSSYDNELDEYVDVPTGPYVNVKSITIPQNITKCGAEAFSGCVNVDNISINSTIDIGGSILRFDNAFNQQITLTIGGECKNLPNNMFWAAGKTSFIFNLDTNVMSIGQTRATVDEVNILPNATTLPIDMGCNGDISYLEIPETVVGLTSDGYSNYYDNRSLIEICNKSNIKLRRNGSSIDSCCRHIFSDPADKKQFIENGFVIYPDENDGNIALMYIGNNRVNDENIIVPDGVTRLCLPREPDINTFFKYGTDGILSITLPNSLIEIPCCVFIYSGLTNVIGTEQLKYIGYNAFFSSNMDNINIPNVEFIGDDAFGYTNLYYNADDGLFYVGDCLCGYKGEVPDGTSIVINDGTRLIASGAFSHNTNLVGSLNLPESIEYINASAFYQCRGLNGVLTIPKNVKRIGYDAFTECGFSTLNYNAEDCSFRDYGQDYDVGNLHFPTTISQVTIGDNVKSIPYGFVARTAITDITIPDSVTSIGGDAFLSCSNLSNVIFGETSSLERVGYNAFADTKWYNNQPDGIVYVGKVLYHYKGAMPIDAHIEIGNDIVSITDFAFTTDQDENLTSIKIGSGVKNIGESIFCGCDGLESIIVADENTTYHSVNNCIIDTENKILVAGCANSIIPDDGSVLIIGGGAFNACGRSLKHITIPDGITHIGASAFNNSCLEGTIEIPNSVQDIGNGAFSQCDGLNTIIIGSGVKHIGNGAFSMSRYIKRVFYAGTPEQWANLDIEADNYYLLDAEITYNYVG